MTRVCDLPHGWTLVRDGATGRAFFKRRGHAIGSYDLAGLPEARTVFRDVNRRLGVMDKSGYRSDDRDYYAMDWAKFSLEMSLRDRRRWSQDLLEN